MRNLKCIHRTRYLTEAHLPCTASTWDPINDAIIYTLGPTANTPTIELRRIPAQLEYQQSSELLASWDAPCPLRDLNVDQIISIHQLITVETTCLVLAGGDIVLVRLQPLPHQEKIEIVGTVDVGITAAAWAPDEDLLAITTRGNTLLYMTAEFDSVASVEFSPEDTQLSKQVSVGWGKSETQFKGKRAKSLRDPTVPEVLEKGAPSSSDQGDVSISWRGDGAFVAVNTAEPQSWRMTRVFSRDGVIDSVSEPIDGLEGSLAWKPSGQLIAGVKRDEDSVKVVFFERNGLRHGEFSLRLTGKDAKTWAARISLSWNVDSTVLAISFLDRVQLWTVENYHYYLKQELLFDQLQSVSPLKINWHPEDPTRFSVQEGAIGGSQDSASGKNAQCERPNRRHALSLIRATFTLSESSAIQPHDYGMVIVIDGNVLRVTPLRLASVPPPIALHEISLGDKAIDATVNIDSSLIAVLIRDSISLYQCNTKYGNSLTPSLREVIPIPTSANVVASQITVINKNNVYVLLQDLSSNTYSIYDVSSKLVCYTVGRVDVRMLLCSSVRYESVWLAQNQRVSKLETTIGDASEWSKTAITPLSLPDEAMFVKVWTTQGRDLAFGLSLAGCLYLNESLILRNCTSFLLTEEHLVLTTNNHRLKFADLKHIESIDIPSDDSEADERCRAIERGAKLIAVMPTSCSVNLQMPRGNIETIFPRVLVLANVRQNIDRVQYKNAFIACRNHRVDMNILHDYNPEQFMNSVATIVRQLEKPEFIDLFLSQLRDENVCETLYRKTLHSVTLFTDRPPIASESFSDQPVNGSTNVSNVSTRRRNSKVNRICDAFLAVLQHLQKSHLQSYVTAHVCKNPPDVEAGLLVISELSDTEPDMVEPAVEHICFLTDTNLAYDAALALYDLNLALAVAQQSQRDPREYLPYLQQLEIEPVTKRQFHIDNDLRRYVKALSHLHQDGDIHEVLAYAEKHELYREALELNKYNKSNSSKIMRAYADFLNGRSQFKEAAIAYESLADYASASSAYCSAQMWQESLSSAHLAQLPSTSIATLAQSLADALLESRSFYAAGTLLSQHLGRLPEAARAFCKGYHFADATRVLALYNRADIIPELLDSELAEAFSTLTELIAECKGQLLAQIPRLHELREKRQRDPFAFFEGMTEAGQPGQAGADVAENISLAPSETTTAGGTLLTRYTGRATGTNATGNSRRTSKNRRREERKRARGKKGSVYEEEYLVNSVERLIGRVNETSEYAQRTVEALCRRSMRERAQALEDAFVALVQLCDTCVLEVWGAKKKEKDDGNEVQKGEEDQEKRPGGADGVLWESMNEVERGRPPPTVRPFASSILLKA